MITSSTPSSVSSTSQFAVGAGVLPLATKKRNKNTSANEGSDDEQQKPCVLLHKMFQGNKVGYLVDFGGAFDSTLDGDPLECAAREFAEETAGLLWPSSCSSSSSSSTPIELRSFATRDELYGSEEVALAKKRTEEFLRRAFEGGGGSDSPLSVHPVSRYHCYVLPIDWREASELNQAFTSTSLYKRREFVWVPVEEILNEALPTYSILHPRLQTDDMRRILTSVLHSTPSTSLFSS